MKLVGLWDIEAPMFLAISYLVCCFVNICSCFTIYVLWALQLNWWSWLKLHQVAILACHINPMTCSIWLTSKWHKSWLSVSRVVINPNYWQWHSTPSSWLTRNEWHLVKMCASLTFISSSVLKCKLLFALIWWQLVCFHSKLEKKKTFPKMKKHGCKAESFCQTFFCVSCRVRVWGEHLKTSKQQNMVRNGAVQVRRGEVKSWQR